ncbi:MAG: tRNA uridine-5-carboxymethylaminomethyl(34) synthesis GTPase MnmE [Roseburia sp.]|nr:tRNA uridine-5-carboxymethylaminomethyl(34) synthesis GTPase MnmE [Roseburia sp.]
MNTIDKNNDIIVALASPYGKSAVAIIRISGNNCIETVARFLSHAPEVGKIKLNKFYGNGFTENLMVACYRAPNSYTGQDSVELFPHGNTVICDGIIKTLVENGARAAEKGEFTKRALLNGKLDLMQCEALADIIDAQTTEQLVYGNARYDETFKTLHSAQKLLNNALSLVEAVLHYGDELEEGERDENALGEVYSAIEKTIDVLEEEKSKYAGGRIVNDGFTVALIGKPNVGKSTLLNALTESDRAIVTPIAGTTRDILDGSYVYKGKKFTVIDTAGIKNSTDDEVERIGIDRALAAAERADAVLYVSEEGVSDTVDDVAASEKAVRVRNKCDGVRDVKGDYRAAEKDGVLQISAKFGKNIDALKQKLYDLCPKEYGGICNHRQYDCVVRCLDHLKAAQVEREKAEGLEIVAALLFDAYSAIEELFGEKADEKILDSVFERFCVGK